MLVTLGLKGLTSCSPYPPKSCSLLSYFLFMLLKMFSGQATRLSVVLAIRPPDWCADSQRFNSYWCFSFSLCNPKFMMY